ncbi:MAG: HIT domain-containing protein [Spirochaetes bacterium]|jgi:ATP adenylyltransferase|nr:HIT domain-containing protein [Spirochaetota bacterium]
MIRDHLFNTEKIKYVKSRKTGSGCILCAIRDRDPDVKSLEVFRSGGLIVTLNLYPFNPGHLMIFPARHIDDISLLDKGEAAGLHELLVKALKILKEEFDASGFNVGYNLGENSGASIAHIHMQIVPRYPNELGFIDIISGSRVYVNDPAAVMDRLKKRFEEAEAEDVTTG